MLERDDDRTPPMQKQQVGYLALEDSSARVNCSIPSQLRSPSCCAPAPKAESGARNTQEPASAAAVKASVRKHQPSSASRKLDAAPGRTEPDRSVNAHEQKAAQAHLAQVRDASHNGKVKRTDLIAAVLRTTPQTTLKKLMKALNREFDWKCSESNLTGHLYTNPKMFTHTEADRSGKNPIRWSLK